MSEERHAMKMITAHQEEMRSSRHRRRSESRSPPPPPRRHSRSRSRSPRRSASPSRRMDTDSKPREFRSSRYESQRSASGNGDSSYDPAKRAHAREHVAQIASRNSKKECRVYVGNLSFGAKWNDLKDFMREAGTVVFSEIMMLPNGMSKGCGVVEFSRPEEAQRAIRDLNEQPLLGRPVFIREDREDDARYGAAAVSGRPGYTGPGATTRGGFAGSVGRGGGFSAPPPGQGRHLYVTGLPPSVGWQDLKDLFRAAGQIIRADVKVGMDGVSSGTGTVVFETSEDAQNAIAMYNGFEFQGSILEVREDRFPKEGGVGRGGFAPRGGFGGRGGFNGAPAHLPFAPPGFQGNVMRSAPPSNQIFVRNLPWSTSDEDLVELFQTTGVVEEAEMLIDEATGRSKGSGVVQFASIDEAQTAISKFQGYTYGGRPLQLEFNARYKNFQGRGVPEGAPTGPSGGGQQYDDAEMNDSRVPPPRDDRY